MLKFYYDEKFLKKKQHYSNEEKTLNEIKNNKNLTQFKWKNKVKIIYNSINMKTLLNAKKNP